MNKGICFTLGLVLFACLSAHSQSQTTRKDYKVVNSDVEIESGKKLLIVDYLFKGSTIKTREKYFDDREEQAEGLATEIRNFTGCEPQLEIINNTGTIIGRKVVCKDKLSKTYTVAYSHFDVLNKVNVISGESQSIVDEFVKGICPYAYHLYPDIDCPGFK